MVAILMMSAKLATLDILKIRVYWNKGYNVKIPALDITSKILLGNTNYIVNVAMWPKIGNSSVSMREVIII